MSKQVITIDGEERLVREDTAKAYRGVNWALISIAAFILIAAALLFSTVLTGVYKQTFPVNNNPGSTNAQ